MTRYDGNGNVRWGVIGLGWFGEIHADTLAGMPGIELAALCTRRPERLEELANRYHVAGRYVDYKELLADPSIDAVGITTHIDDHRDIAVAALRAGKHVFLEKPMAPTVEDCNQIIQAAKDSEGLFMVGHITGPIPIALAGTWAIGGVLDSIPSQTVFSKHGGGSQCLSAIGDNHEDQDQRSDSMDLSCLESQGSKSRGRCSR